MICFHIFILNNIREKSIKITEVTVCYNRIMTIEMTQTEFIYFLILDCEYLLSEKCKRIEDLKVLFFQNRITFEFAKS